MSISYCFFIFMILLDIKPKKGYNKHVKNYQPKDARRNGI